MFELRGSSGVLCKARMPALGSGTNFDIRRIDAHPYLATIVKGPVKEDPKLCQDFVWRLTTQIDFFSPRRSRPWQEQIGRMDVELDGSTHREYRLKDKEDKKGQVYKEWETYDSHKVERWRVALQPMMRARRHVATHLHDKPSEADFRRDIMAGRCIFRNGDSSLVGPAVVQAPGPPRPAHPHGAARWSALQPYPSPLERALQPQAAVRRTHRLPQGLGRQLAEAGSSMGSEDALRSRKCCRCGQGLPTCTAEAWCPRMGPLS